MDVFRYCKAERLEPSVGVPVLLPLFEESNPGLAGNTYENIKSLLNNGHGEGPFGSLDNKPILGTVKLKTNEFWKEVKKIRYVETKSGHMWFRVDEQDGKYGRLFLDDLSEFDVFDCIVISDYAKGFLSTEQISIISKHHPLVILDSKHPLDSWAENCFFIKVNSQEYRNAKRITNKMKEKLIITLGPNGVWHSGKLYSVPNVAIKNLSGAGDSFVAGFTVEFLKNKDVEKAITFANKVATATVQKKGVSTVSMMDLEEVELMEDLFICRNCSEDELKCIMDK